MLSKKSKIIVLTGVFLISVAFFAYKKMFALLFGAILFYFFLFYLLKKKNGKNRCGHFKKRAKTLSRICFFFILILIVRLFQIQIVNHNMYEEISSNQLEATYSIKGDRGRILDFSGKPLAYNKNSYNVVIDPSRVYQNKKAMEALKDIHTNYLNIEYDSLKENIYRLGSSGRMYKIIAKNIDDEKKEKIDSLIKNDYELKHYEIFFQKNNFREYYREDIFSHLVGITGYTEKTKDSKPGIFGVEMGYDRYLEAREITKKDIFTRSRFMKLPTASDEIELSGNGKDIYLTIDYFLQYILNEEVKEQFEKTNSEMAIGLIMEPSTGRILATSKFTKKNSKNLKNQLIQSQYEPGSTFKPIVVASAIEEGLVKPYTTFDIGEGKITRYRHTIKESSRNTKGVLSTEEVLKKSSNVGMVLISDRFENAIFEKYLKSFGFGDRTGIDLPGELSPYFEPYKKWNGLKKNTMAFGQGIAVTPIQLATAFSSVINGGVLYTPYVVDRIVGENGVVIRRNTPHPVRRVISQKVSEEMKGMLEQVVADGTAKNAAVDGYRIGGKTGTAQISSPGGYLRGEYLASFIGFFPVNNPQYLMLFMFMKPQADIYYNKFGGAVAAPVFKEVAKRIIKYRNMLPGDIDYFEGDEIKLPENIASEVMTEMPELTGKSAREVLKILGKLNLEVEVVGTGLVRSQWPKAGTKIENINKVKINLE